MTVYTHNIGIQMTRKGWLRHLGLFQIEKNLSSSIYKFVKFVLQSSES